jgi:AcrR family transcriptional regulator
MNVHSAPFGTKDKVLAAAMELFARQGYHATSVPDIQRQAGVSTGAIYRHFASKDDIAAAVYAAALRAIGATFQQSLAGDQDFFERFGALVRGLFALTENDPHLIEYGLYVKHREIGRDIGPICSSEPFLYLQARVADAMRSGQLRPGDVILTTATLMGPVQRVIQLHLDDLLCVPLRTAVDPLLDNVRRALTPDPRRRNS